MPQGIIVFGANGSGKPTIGRELARALRFKGMEIEDYHFIKSEFPYAVERPREDCIHSMLTDIKTQGSFVLSAVIGEILERKFHRCIISLF